MRPSHVPSQENGREGVPLPQNQTSQCHASELCLPLLGASAGRKHGAQAGVCRCSVPQQPLSLLLPPPAHAQGRDTRASEAAQQKFAAKPTCAPLSRVLVPALCALMRNSLLAADWTGTSRVCGAVQHALVFVGRAVEGLHVRMKACIIAGDVEGLEATVRSSRMGRNHSTQ